MLHRFDLSGAWLARDSDYQRGKPAFAQRDVIDQARYIPANVPGEIHLDLMKAGLIADVYRSANCLAARWVEEHIWSYRREFDAPAEARELHSRVWLYFEGLDYAAEIFLNGIKVGEHANFFRPCRVEVTGKLRERGNVLTVHLDSGLYHVADKPAEGYYHEKGGLLHKRHWASQTAMPVLLGLEPAADQCRHPRSGLARTHRRHHPRGSTGSAGDSQR